MDSDEEAVMPLFKPGEGMEEPGQSDAAQAAGPTAEADKDAAQAEVRIAGPAVPFDLVGAEEDAAQAPTKEERAGEQTGLSAAPSPAPTHGFETPQCTPPGQGYFVPESLKELVQKAQCSVSLH